MKANAIDLGCRITANEEIPQIGFTASISSNDRIIIYVYISNANISWYRLYIDSSGIKYQKMENGNTVTIWSK